MSSLEVSNLGKDDILNELMSHAGLEPLDEIDTVLVLRSGTEKAAAPVVVHHWTAADGDF